MRIRTQDPYSCVIYKKGYVTYLNNYFPNSSVPFVNYPMVMFCSFELQIKQIKIRVRGWNWHFRVHDLEVCLVFHMLQFEIENAIVSYLTGV